MHGQTSLLLAAGMAHLATASRFSKNEPGRRALTPRDLEECEAVFSEFVDSFDSFPTPPTELVDIVIETSPTRECEVPLVTGEGAAEFTSYFSELLSWYNANTALTELVSSCTDIPEISSEINDYPVITNCPSFIWPEATATGAPSNATATVTTTVSTRVPGPTGGAGDDNETSDNGDSNDDSEGDNSEGGNDEGAASRQTGTALAALAAAGVAVAYLF